MKNFKILWAIICTLLIVLIAVAYKFVQGSVALSDDERVAVVLSKDERNLILSEMRNFLISTKKSVRRLPMMTWILLQRSLNRQGWQRKQILLAHCWQKYLYP
jgi:hypothetical protein